MRLRELRSLRRFSVVIVPDKPNTCDIRGFANEMIRIGQRSLGCRCSALSLMPACNGHPRENCVSAADTLPQNYKDHLRKDCRLTANSVLVYAPFIREFLAAQTTQTRQVPRSCSIC
jgi:hypothetical protein